MASIEPGQNSMDSGEALKLRTDEIVKEHARAHDLLDGHGIERLSEPDDGTGERHWLSLSARIVRLESRRVNDGKDEQAERPAVPSTPGGTN